MRSSHWPWSVKFPLRVRSGRQFRSIVGQARTKKKGFEAVTGNSSQDMIFDFFVGRVPLLLNMRGVPV